MKKRITMALLVAAILVLTACGSRSEAVPSTVNEQLWETEVTEIETRETGPILEPGYPGTYWRTWSEEIAGTVMEMNSYIVLNEDHSGCWLAQDVGTLTWNEGQLILTVGAVYKIAVIQESDTANLLVYEFQDENGVWQPTAFEKIEKLPVEMEVLIGKG